jgi:hypothetical protein
MSDEDDSNEDKSFSLAELADDVAPRTFDLWNRTTRELAWVKRRWLFLNNPRDEMNIDGLYWVPGIGLRRTRQRQLNERRERLFAWLCGNLREAIGSSRCTTTGIGPMGNPIVIQRELAPQLVIDLDDNTLATPDGGMIWRAIRVKRRATKQHPVFDIEIAKAWMTLEMMRRRDTGGDTGRDAMVIAVRREYPDLGARDARNTFTKLSKALKKRPGPRPRAVSGQKKGLGAGTVVPELKDSPKD